ncbi:hypothetical protein LUI11_15985 [Bradyrhizobium diazoefficiens]|uniref:Uncharacterized protein n=1 Tax=Bradyrhizobium diazoefficiens SEMIA 5080 TaxID=754504 RepID=A0A837C969_9BRAD|nr:hypothetical protein [Bradyrhizobium diazoefficiens]APO49869.1 hypothetical protein BD122_06505 [Bradyrhizobium diazoefficiens]KGJ65712.1 hypothetical protein BJA5080_02357 [Bradyrhizobium diazoefficiens SEMIA 5080]KOY07368.1 hypothetical protein AF336_25615 [Bradyrhizobium diazoefficiens]MCD9295796.1 hypothetical protein [Bradyrhizobium diazoefficiens]MCD9810305.1 hypothetical protein [Bradyrhizobium diazoefficiens]
MDPRVAKLDFKRTGRLWIAARVGMTLPELFSLGLTTKHICRYLPEDRLVFDPVLSDAEVIDAYKGWRRERRRLTAIAGHERRRSTKGPRTCMCCRKVFESEGNHNRLCRYCKDRAGLTYDPW